MSLTEMIGSGSANPVLLFLFALLLGSLHGLEPGHSKTMMVAYIIAVQGTVKQAVLLGIAATFSHSIIVWILAIVALTVGNDMIGEELEPWFMIASGVIVLGIAAWMLWQATGWGRGHHHHEHRHLHAGHPDLAHAHAHGDHHHDDHVHDASHSDFANAGEPAMDAHARAHAAEIRARVADGRTGTWQTILFGLSGGMIPCPAAITVFILCLHLGKLALGITLVTAFSLGLAATLVTIGIVAAVGLRVVFTRTTRFDRIMRAAPWLAAALVAVVGAFIIWSGLSHLHALSHDH